MTILEINQRNFNWFSIKKKLIEPSRCWGWCLPKRDCRLFRMMSWVLFERSNARDERTQESSRSRHESSQLFKVNLFFLYLFKSELKKIVVLWVLPFPFFPLHCFLFWTFATNVKNLLEKWWFTVIFVHRTIHVVLTYKKSGRTRWRGDREGIPTQGMRRSAELSAWLKNLNLAFSPSLSSLSRPFLWIGRILPFQSCNSFPSNSHNSFGNI